MLDNIAHKITESESIPSKRISGEARLHPPLYEHYVQAISQLEEEQNEHGHEESYKRDNLNANNPSTEVLVKTFNIDSYAMKI